MNNYRLAYFFFIGVVFLMGCENTVRIELPAPPQQISVVGQFVIGDSSTYDVFVSSPISIQDSVSYEPLKDAEVELFENGSLFETFLFDDSLKKFFPHNNNLTFLNNAVYSLKVSDSELESAEVEQILPLIVSDLHAEFLDDGGPLDEFGQPMDRLIISFDDMAGVQNFYGIKNVFHIGEHIVNNEMITDTFATIGLDTFDEYLLSSESYPGYYRFIFKDETFDGGNPRINLYGHFTNDFTKEIVIQVSSLTKDSFLYRASYMKYKEVGFDIFSEPVSIHQNIENGIGIFSMDAITTIKIEF